MSKQVLKNLLDVFDSGAFGGSSRESTGKAKEKPSKLKTVITKKKAKKTSPFKKAASKTTTKVSQIELYKALRASTARYQPNLKNIKRKFFKHNPDQVSDGFNTKKQASVFSDRDFENFMSK